MSEAGLAARVGRREVLLGGLAATASADTVSAAYCNAVAQKYERYLGGTAARGRLQSGVETNQAMEACKRGDTSGVAVLEKALQNAKIPLPPRS